MKKVIKSSVKKILDKKQQKAIVGGICHTGGYPIICLVNGVWRRTCPDMCD